MKISKTRIITYIPLLILCIVSSCYEIFLIAGGSITLLMGIEIVAIILLFIRNKDNNINSFAILLFVMSLFILLNNALFPSFQFFYKTTTYILVFLFCYTMKNSNEWIEMFTRTSLYIYSFYIFTTIWLSLDRSTYMSYIVNLFPDNKSRLIMWYNNGWMAGFTNHYSTNAMFLSLALIFFVCSLFKFNNFRNKLVNYAGIGLSVVALLLTGKRGPLMFTVIALFITLFLFLSDKPKKRTTKIVLIVSAAICVMGLLITIFPQLGNSFLRFQEGMEEGDVTTGRTKFWGLAATFFFQNPLFGIGWLKYSQVMQQYTGYDKAVNVHNVFLQLFCETGIIGALVFLIWFGLLLKTAIDAFVYIRKNGNLFNNKDNYYMSISVSIQCYFLLYAITGNTLYDAPMFIPYFLACGIALHYKSKIIQIKRNLQPRRN